MCCACTPDRVTGPSSEYTGGCRVVYLRLVLVAALFSLSAVCMMPVGCLPGQYVAFQYQTAHQLLLLLPACLPACSALNWEPDEQGINGMVITKTLPSEAANALEKGVRKMTPKIMTWGQYAEAAVNYIQAAAAYMSNEQLCKTPGPYVPDYTRCAGQWGSPSCLASCTLWAPEYLHVRLSCCDATRCILQVASMCFCW